MHIHARVDGAPTYRKDVYAEIIGAVRERCPDLIICVSCSGRNFGELAQRAEVLELAGSLKPDLASLTLGSMNFPKQASVNAPETIRALAEKMRRANVVPELEAFEIGMVDTARYLLETGVLARPFYINLIFGSGGTLTLNPTNFAAMVAAVPHGGIWSAGGIGRHQLAANIMGLAGGGHVRLGLKDTLFMDADHREPATNARLVERIVTIGRALGREPASPQEARNIIGLANCP